MNPISLSVPEPGTCRLQQWGRMLGRLIGCWLPHLAVLGLLAVFAMLQWQSFTPGSREPDSDGYLLLAERMAAGLPAGDAVDDPYRYHSHVWVNTRDGSVVPKYTPGYPLLMAAAYRVAGPLGPFAVSPVCGLLALLGAWLLFRLWMSPWLAVCAVAVLAFSNMTLIYTNYVLAHAASLCAVVWGMYCLWRWVRSPRPGWALGAGLLLGFAVLVRSTNAVFALTIGIAGLRVLSGRPDTFPGCPAWRRRLLSATLLGMAYGAMIAALAWYNWRWFGDPFSTGYALSQEQSAFSAAGLPQQIERLLNGLVRHGPGPVMVLGFFGLLACRRHTERLMRLSWFLPVLLVYAAYYWSATTDGVAVLRFLLCTFPVLIGGAFALLANLQVHPLNRLVLALLLAAGGLYPELRQREGLVNAIARPSGLQVSAVVGQTVAPLLDEGAVVVAYGFSLHAAGFGRQLRVYHWEELDAAALLRRLSHQSRGAPRQQPERREQLLTFFRAQSQHPAELRRQLLGGHLDAGRQVVMVLQGRRMRMARHELGPAFRLDELHAWTMDAVWPARWSSDSDERRAGGEWSVYSVHRNPEG